MSIYIRKITAFFAINGKNFCGACADALGVIMSNALRFAALGGIGGLFTFIGICKINK